MKDTVHLFKTTMLYPSSVPIQNVKLKRVSKVYHVIYNNFVGKNTMSRCQRVEESTKKYVRSYIMFI